MADKGYLPSLMVLKISQIKPDDVLKDNKDFKILITTWSSIIRKKSYYLLDDSDLLMESHVS